MCCVQSRFFLRVIVTSILLSLRCRAVHAQQIIYVKPDGGSNCDDVFAVRDPFRMPGLTRRVFTHEMSEEFELVTACTRYLHESSYCKTEAKKQRHFRQS